MSEYKLKINGNEYDVTVGAIEDGIAKVNVNGTDYEVEMEKCATPQPAQTAPQAAPAVTPAAKPAGEGRTVTSPLPGVIIDVCVKEGQSVRRGEKIAVLEAMKMENEIQTASDGTVTAIHVSKGDSVLEGAAIATIA